MTRTRAEIEFLARSADLSFEVDAEGNHVAVVRGPAARRAVSPPARRPAALKTALVDYHRYQRFSELLNVASASSARQKTAQWTIKTIEEIYSARFAYETAELRETTSKEI
jgi:hypothetical protein